MFHFQNPIVDWPECIKFLPPGYTVKFMDNVQQLDEAKRRKSTIKTVLRHWYTAQVPDGMLESAIMEYEKAIELDIPVHFHMGWTPLINAPMKYQDPVLLDEVGIRFRQLKVIVAHLGYWISACYAPNRVSNQKNR